MIGKTNSNYGIITENGKRIPAPLSEKLETKEIEAPYLHNSEAIEISTPNALKIGHTSEDIPFSEDVENSLQLGDINEEKCGNFVLIPTWSEEADDWYNDGNWHLSGRNIYTSDDITGIGSDNLCSGHTLVVKRKVDSPYIVTFTALTTGRSKIWLKIEHSKETGSYSTIKTYVAGSNSDSNSFASLIRSDKVWKTFSITFDQPLGSGYLKFTFGSDNDADSPKGLYINHIKLQNASGVVNKPKSTYIEFTKDISDYDYGGINAYIKGRKALALKHNKLDVFPGDILNVNMGDAKSYDDAETYLKLDNEDKDFKIAFDGRRMVQLKPATEYTWSDQSFIDSSNFKHYSSGEIEFAAGAVKNNNVSDSDDYLTPKVRKPAATILLGNNSYEDSRMLTYEQDLAIGMQYNGTKDDPDDEDGSDEVFRYYADKGENPNAGLKISEYYHNDHRQWYSAPDVEVFGSPFYKTSDFVLRKFCVDPVLNWRNHDNQGYLFCSPNKFTYSKVVFDYNNVENNSITINLSINLNKQGITPGQYVIFSNLDTDLSYDKNIDTTYKYKVAFDETNSTVAIVYDNLTVGEHFITIKGINNSEESFGYTDSLLVTSIDYNPGGSEGEELEEISLDLSTISNDNMDSLYGFTYSNGKLSSTNGNINNSYSYAKLSFTLPETYDVAIDINQHSHEQYWDYGIISNLDTFLSKNNNGSDAVQKANFQSSNGNHRVIYKAVVPGEHFVTIKFRTDTSVASTASGLDITAITLGKNLKSLGETGIKINNFETTGSSQYLPLISNSNIRKKQVATSKLIIKNTVANGTLKLYYQGIDIDFGLLKIDGSTVVIDGITSLQDNVPVRTYTNIPIGTVYLDLQLTAGDKDIRKNSFDITKVVLNDEELDLSTVTDSDSNIILKKQKQGYLPRVGIGISKINGELQQNLDNDNMCMIFRPDGVIDIKNTITKHEDEYDFNLNQSNKGKIRVISDSFDVYDKDLNNKLLSVNTVDNTVNVSGKKVVTLNYDGKVPTEQIPNYIDYNTTTLIFDCGDATEGTT